jgi:peptidoglycan/LPS O-acetylase OafA/YrhL
VLIPQHDSRLQWIDALRGYAIVGVIAAHLELFPHGVRGVQLFFLASAISLLHSWHNRKDGAAYFYVRRFFRIAPMFYFSIPAFIWLASTAGAAPTPMQVGATVTGLFWITPDWQNSVVPGSWSIACEVLFYSIFPLLADRLDTFKKSALALGGSIAVAALAWPLLTAYAGKMGADSALARNAFAFAFITTQLPCFLAGFCVYFAASSQRIARLCGAAGTALMLAVLLWPQRSAFYIAFVASFALIAYSLSNGVLSVLNSRLMAWIGIVSYSAYFWHFFLIGLMQLMMPQFGGVWQIVFVVIITFGASFLTYRIIERPTIRLGARAQSWSTFLKDRQPQTQSEWTT